MAKRLRLPTRRDAAGTWVTCDTCRQMTPGSRAFYVLPGGGRRCFRCAVLGKESSRE